MKNSVSRKDYFILGLIFVPLIFGITIHAISWYSREAIGQWIIFVLSIKNLMVNISYGVIGMVLCFQPEFFIRFLQKYIKYQETKANVLKLLLRFIGLGLLIIISVASCVSVQEITSTIQILGQ